MTRCCASRGATRTKAMMKTKPGAPLPAIDAILEAHRTALSRCRHMSALLSVAELTKVTAFRFATASAVKMDGERGTF